MRLKTFEQFNEQVANESIIGDVKNFFKNIIKNVKDWFFGEDAFIKNLKKLEKEVPYKQSGIKFYDFREGAAVKESVVNEAETKNVRKGIPLEHPSSEVPNYNHEELKFELDRVFKDPSNDGNPTPFIWGSFGIGKTDVVKSLAKEHGCVMILVNLSLRDPVDFIGLPSIEKGRTVFNLPQFFPDENPKDESLKKGILFFDEMNRANGPVLSSSLQLVLSRELENYKLPKGWMLVAAGNRSIEAPEVTDLGGALANRVSHMNLVPDVKSWSNWAEVQKDKEGPMIDYTFISFLMQNKEYFHSFTGDPNSPWPSPRSWSQAALNYRELLKKHPKMVKNTDFLTRSLAKQIGMDAATAFVNFLKLTNEFSKEDIEMVYTNPQKAKLPPKNGQNFKSDVTYAILSAIVFSKKETGMTVDEFINLIEYATRLKEFEYGTMVIRMVKQNYENVFKDKKVIKALEDFQDSPEIKRILSNL